MEIIRVDDREECPRCAGKAHDFIGNRGKGTMAIQCCYCLYISHVAGSINCEEHEARKSSAGSYVLKHGRHKGKTIAEVAASGERGEEYLRLLAKDSKALKPLIDACLSSRPAVGALHHEAASR